MTGLNIYCTAIIIRSIVFLFRAGQSSLVVIDTKLPKKLDITTHDTQGCTVLWGYGKLWRCGVKTNKLSILFINQAFTIRLKKFEKYSSLNTIVSIMLSSIKAYTLLVAVYTVGNTDLTTFCLQLTVV